MQEDGEKYVWVFFILGPFMFPFTMVNIALILFVKGLVYFTAKERHQRKLKKAKRERELKKIENDFEPAGKSPYDLLSSEYKYLYKERMENQ